MLSRKIIVLTIMLSGLSAISVSAGQWRLTLDPGATSITFKLDATLHTVEGSFALESGELRFDPDSGAASGEVIVDARSGQTGIGRRDQKIHANVLESHLYPMITFQPERLLGEVSMKGSSSALLRGVLTIHGDRHSVTMPTTLEVDGDLASIKAALAIPYVEWGMFDPSRWYLRVAKEVFVLIEAEGTLAELTD